MPARPSLRPLRHVTAVSRDLGSLRMSFTSVPRADSDSYMWGSGRAGGGGGGGGGAPRGSRSRPPGAAGS
eukprot:169842-Rhodomonas_salina.3